VAIGAQMINPRQMGKTGIQRRAGQASGDLVHVILGHDVLSGSSTD
jgi:hypothetical protein